MFEVGDEVVVANRGYYRGDVGLVQHVLHRRGVVKRQAVDNAFNLIGTPFYEEYNELWVLLDNGVWMQDVELRLVLKDDW